jgi:hypothetical protein
VDVFYLADASSQQLIAYFVSGPGSIPLQGMTISLGRKLSGWVADQNCALLNLPAFPDCASLSEPRPIFEMCAIAPLNWNGQVLGALSLYRVLKEKFSKEEFWWLETVALRTSLALSRYSNYF